MSYRSDHEQSTRALSAWIETRDFEAITRHLVGESARLQPLCVPVHSAVCTAVGIYGPSRRKVGAPAAVHPLRVARRLRCMGVTAPSTLVAALGHDLVEDHQHGFDSVEGLTPHDFDQVQHLIELMTRGETESYFDYIARLTQDPTALLIKLVDRLDNTYDLRVSSDPGLVNPGEVYRVLFRRAVLDTLDTHREIEHPHKAPIRTSRRLFDIFKSLVLLHFVRRHSTPARVDEAAKKLSSIACAEAELTALHLLEFHDSPGLARRVTSELVAYGDRFWRVTSSGTSMLDGLLQVFDARLSKHDDSALQSLQQDLPHMLMAAMSIVVVLTRFEIDPTFQGIAGLDERGVRTVPPREGSLPPAGVTI